MSAPDSSYRYFYIAPVLNFECPRLRKRIQKLEDHFIEHRYQCSIQDGTWLAISPSPATSPSFRVTEDSLLSVLQYIGI